MSKIVELEKQLMQRNKELDVVRVSVVVTVAPWAPWGGRSGLHLAEPACQRNALGQPICWDYFRGGPPKKSVQLWALHECMQSNAPGSMSLSQVLGTTIFSHLDESELIM